MFEVLNTLSNYAPVVPFAIGGFLWRELDRGSKIIMLLLFCATFSQLFSRFNFGLPNVWPVFNVYILIDTCLWALVFFTSSNRRVLRCIIIMLFLAHAFLFSYVAFNVSLQSRFFSEFVCLNCLLQLLWVLMFLYERYKTDAVRNLGFEPLFWYSLGLLVYSPTTYFLFAYYNIVRAVKTEGYTSLWAIHDVVNISMYSLFAVGMSRNMKMKQMSN